MKNLFKFSTLNFIGNELMLSNSMNSLVDESAKDQKKITSRKEVKDCNISLNGVNTYIKSIIICFLFLGSCFKMNGQGCMTGHESCLIPNVTYQCIGVLGASNLFSDLIGINNKLLPYTVALTTPQYIIIEGDVIVDEKYVFASGSDIVFVNYNNSTLKVKDELKILNSEIKGCTDMWQKIEVESGGSLYLSDSKIFDSELGIYPMAGSIIDIKNNEFVDCFQCVTAENGSFVNSIRENTFYGENNSSSILKHPKIGIFPRHAILGAGGGHLIVKNNKFYNYGKTYCSDEVQINPAVNLYNTSADITNANHFNYCCNSI